MVAYVEGVKKKGGAFSMLFKVARSLLKLHDRCTVVVEAVRLFSKQQKGVFKATRSFLRLHKVFSKPHNLFYGCTVV